MEMLDQLKESFLLEWRSKRTVRFSIYSVSVVLLAFGALDLSEINNRKVDQALELKAQRQILQRDEGVDIWANRLAEVSSLLERQRQTIWQAGSDGLARAKFQKIAKDFFDVPERRSPIVEVGASIPIKGLKSVNRVRARVRLNLSPDELVGALTKIENSDKVVNIERLRLNYSLGRWTVDLVLNAFFEIKES